MHTHTHTHTHTRLINILPSEGIFSEMEVRVGDVKFDVEGVPGGHSPGVNAKLSSAISLFHPPTCATISI